MRDNMKHVTAPLLLFVALFLALCLTVPSCGGVDCKDPKNAGSAKCTAEQSMIDCTAPDVITYVTTHAKDVFHCFSPAPDWACLETALIHLGASEARCVLEHEFDHYLATGQPTPPTPDVGSGSVGSGAGPVKATLPPQDPAALTVKKDELAAKLWPGKTVKK